MTEIYLDHKRLRINPADQIGKGGEADIYRLSGGRALKLFKGPKHPDFAGQPALQQIAKSRLTTHQGKLPAFPSGLPYRVVTPQALAHDQAGRIIGYIMPMIDQAEVLLRYADRGWRNANPLPPDAIAKLFRDLHGTVDALHNAGVVIGDFNDLNVMVRDTEAYIIDTDSFQFGSYYGEMFTTKFVDPMVCQAGASSLILSRPHTDDTDWYAYAVMLMNSLLYVDPYGGVYRPADPAKRIGHDARPLHRITVWYPEVRYPKPAIPWSALPDELLDYFQCAFEHDKRGTFPLSLLDNLRWTTCTACGAWHARAICPNCRAAGPVRPSVQVRGEVRATKVMSTTGRILVADIQNGKLVWLINDGANYQRENGQTVAAGPAATARYRLSNRQTVIATAHQAIVLTPNTAPQTLAVDQAGRLPMVASNAERIYWADGGTLYRQGPYEREVIGQVLAGQTLFWVGSSFGFGFYQAGELTRAFVFEALGKTLNDSVSLPRLPAQITDATCVFTDQLAWLMISGRDQGRSINRCILLDRRGQVLATAETPAGLGWLGNIRGHVAAGNFLLAATDDGLVRIEANGGSLVVTREFPDSEPFVQAGSQLLVGSDGLYVIGRNEIWRLVIS